MKAHYTLGILFGAVFTAVVCALLFAKKRNWHPGSSDFDERQQIGRGKAYQWGFFTMLIAGSIYAMTDYAMELPGFSLPWVMGIVVLGVAVFAVTAIRYDAFYGFREKGNRYYITGACFLLLMTRSGVANLRRGNPEDVASGIVSLEIAALWLVIVAALLIHNRKGREEE